MRHIPLPPVFEQDKQYRGTPVKLEHTPELEARIMRDAQEREKRRPLAERFSVGVASFERTTIPYRLYVPEHLEPDKKYPLVLYLHGGGERGDDNISQLLANEGALVWVRDQEDAPQKKCFVLAPQSPAGELGWMEPHLLAVNTALETILAQYPIDENRLYLTGVSMGGIGCWYMNYMYPSRFAAAVTCCPAADTDADRLDQTALNALASAFVGKKLWLFHAEDDFVVPVEISRKLVAALEAQGCHKNRDFFYTEYPAEMGLNHGCWEKAYSLNLMRRWLMTQALDQPSMPEHPGKPEVIPPEMQALADQMERDREARKVYLSRFQERVQKRDGITIQYRLYTPPNLVSEKQYPLILFLHGIGECGEDNMAPLVASDGGIGWVAAQDRGEIGPCFVLVPQCPYPIPGLRWEEEYLSVIEEILMALGTELPVDSDRIYATGLSMGGFGVWNLLRMFPEQFAAAVTCCAASLEGTIWENHVDETALQQCIPALRRIPLWMFHAEDDPAVPVTVTQTMDLALRGLGRTPGKDYRVTIYPASKHYGHACWVPAFSSPELRRWVLEQRKHTPSR